MVIGADYPFLDIMWSMLVFFGLVTWFWLMIKVFGDVFRRHDVSGWGKAGWTVLVIVAPILGVLIYLIVEHNGMRERSESQARDQKQAFDSYVRDAAGSGDAASQIAQAKQLLDSGTITQEEFDALKAKALA